MANEAHRRASLIAQYKTLLQGYLDRRPSGLRGKLARELGKHKSFISQITNPAYSVPIPAGDLDTIFEVCRLSDAERHEFSGIYQAAHAQRKPISSRRTTSQSREIRIQIPDFGDPETGKEVEALVREFAERTFQLLDRAKRDSNVVAASDV